MGDGAKAHRRYEDAVEYLCRHIEELRPLIAPAIWESSFPIVRDADPSASAWRDAVRALHNAVESAGIPNGLGLPPVMGVGNWPGGPTPQPAGWVCPASRCARVELRDATTTATPDCALGGGPMRLVDG